MYSCWAMPLSTKSCPNTSKSSVTPPPPPPTDIVLLQVYQNKEIFRNMTYGVTVTSLLKQWENSHLRETKQIIYQSKSNDESFPKMEFLLSLSVWIKSYGHLSGILPILVDLTMTSH